MRHKVQTETKMETRVLGLCALLCYTATFAAMLTYAYALLAFALRAAGRDLAAMLNPAGF